MKRIFFKENTNNCTIMIFIISYLLCFTAIFAFAGESNAPDFVFSFEENAALNDTEPAGFYDMVPYNDNTEDASVPFEALFNSFPVVEIQNFYELQKPLLNGFTNKGIGQKLLNVDGFTMKGKLSSKFKYETGYGTVDEFPTLYLYRDFSDYQLYKSKGIDSDYTVSGGLKWSTPLQGLVLGGKFSRYRLSDNVYRPDILPWSETAMNVFTNDGQLNAINSATASAEQKVGDLRLFVEYTRNLYTYEDESVKEHVSEEYSGGLTYRLTDWFEMTSHFSIYYADAEDKEGKHLVNAGKLAAEAWLKDFALTTEFDVNDRLKIQLEGHLLDGLIGVTDLEDPMWLRYAATMTFSY
jgi:hypothetical protein